MAQRPVLLSVKGLRLSMGDALLFDAAEFTLHKGERAALIGANGAGKSTLVRMLAGLAEPDGGEVAWASGACLGFAPQEASAAGFDTLRDFVCASLGARSAPAARHQADAELEAFGLDPARPAAPLSGGEMRRVTMARAFAGRPDILLLDEPTNHLDIAAIEALEQRLLGFAGACLIVSHDRRFLERTTTATLWLRQRQLLKLDRGFAAFEAWAEQIENEETRNLARLETHLKAEEHWLRRGVTARRSRNEGRRRKLMALRAERRERRAAAPHAGPALTASRGTESGRLVIDAKRIGKTYGEQRLIADFSLRLMRGDRLGIVGPNGAGKTTLLEILLGKREPDAGTLRRGENLTVAYVDQARAMLREDATIWETLAPGGGDQIAVRGQPRHVAAYAQDFLFAPAQLRQPVAALSGGERNRLALAAALAKPANLLVLDEPTNDLDMDALDALEAMLAEYDGTVLLISHDRAFLDGATTQIVGPLGGGKWAETPGGWSDFEREHGGFAPKPAAKTKQAPSASAIVQKKSAKLSYKDERRAQELEALLPRLEAEIAGLEQTLAQSADFGAAAQAAAQRLAQARAEREAGESEWLEIELRREQLLAGQ